MRFPRRWRSGLAFAAPLLVVLALWAVVVPAFHVSPRVFPGVGAVVLAGIAWIPIATLWFGYGFGAITFVILEQPAGSSRSLLERPA